MNTALKACMVNHSPRVMGFILMGPFEDGFEGYDIIAGNGSFLVLKFTGMVRYELSKMDQRGTLTGTTYLVLFGPLKHTETMAVTSSMKRD